MIIRDQLFAAQKIVDGRGMLCNFLENHDKPRSIDRFLMPEDQNRYSEKMLPVTNFFLPGIVFLYQGQEIGMRDDPETVHSWVRLTNRRLLFMTV